MRIRTFVAAGAILLASHALLADTPGGRAETRMVFDPVSNHIILYGGATALDAGTKVSYDLGDTWQWLGDHWVRLSTAHDAGTRSGQVMVYDTNRSRIVMFGGRRTDVATKNQAVLNDTWIFRNGDWSQLATPNSPPGRTVTGAAFDPVRDRIVMYGGNTISTDGKNTVTTLHDTWEFDGTTWNQRGSDGPKISKPIITYDNATNQVILLGLDETSSTKTATLMYLYDASAGTWNQAKPDGLPPCVNESQVAFDPETNSVILNGGVCADSATTEETYSWDGTKWTKLDIKTVLDRTFGAGVAYDPTTRTLFQYGGTIAFGGSHIGTIAFHGGDWASLTDTFSPAPRSLPVVFNYPGNDVVYVYGGHDETGGNEELWTYSNATWTQITGDANKPTLCDNPLGAYDSDRKVYEIVCAAGNVFEFNGTTWTNKKDMKDKPPIRRLGNLSYDPTLKKTVLFGGYDDADFLNQTWLWDGTVWTRVKKNLPPPRAQAVMWYDATMKKTLVYGGVGRQDANSRVERFADMWSFDGTGWTDMKVDPASTPGMRYSTTYGVDPRNGHMLVFGGLLYTKDSANVETQAYVNDLWDWNGSKWTKLTTPLSPEVRENGGLTYDAQSNRMLLFGGYGGHYFGDVWQFDSTTTTWQPLMRSETGGSRRRTAPTPQLPGGGSGLRVGQQ